MVKYFEIRDRGTFIPAFAFRPLPNEATEEADAYLLGRGGWNEMDARDYLYFGRLVDGQSHFDPYDQSSNTMQYAHQHLAKHFDELESGAVIDVEFLRGESKEPKLSERVTS